MFIFSKTGILFALLCIVLVAFAVFWFTAGAGTQKFSRPSRSARDSWLLRAFEKSYHLSGETRSAIHKFTVEDVWLERRIERYESVPITKRLWGYRLCVRMRCEDRSIPVIDNLAIGIRKPDSTLFNPIDATRSGGDIRILTLISSDAKDFPDEGEIVLYDRTNQEEIMNLKYSIEDND